MVSRPTPSSAPSLAVYRLLDRVFPRSFTLKLYLVAFVGTHVPLLTFAVSVVLADEGHAHPWRSLLLLLGATLAGTAVTLGLIRALLRPLYLVAAELRAFGPDPAAARLPEEFEDELGVVMRATQGFLRQVSEMVSDAQDAAERDPLTGLLNRRGLERRLAGLPGGMLLLFDVDRFKQWNDQEGHAAGDALLASLAGVVRSLIRPGDLAVRWGGDEFLVILPKADGAQGARVAERLRQGAAGITLGAGPLCVSMGGALWRAGADLESALLAADGALYEVKRAGGDGFRLAASPPAG
jgi:diguanylate cyclase (GGDEF)-like protein